MSDPQNLKKILFNQDIKPNEILKALSCFNHAVYLQNTEYPIIAFHADEYFVRENGTLKHFVKRSFNEYEQLPIADLSVIKLNNTQNKYSNRFHGGYAGFVSYDYGAAQFVSLRPRSQPELFLAHFSTYIEFESGQWVLNCPAEDIDTTAVFLQNALKNPLKNNHFSLNTQCLPRWSKTQYTAAFEQVQEYIKAGDCYQINLTQEFCAQAQGSLLDTAAEFWSLTDAPYAGYLRINDFEILSCSPELFIDFSSERKIITKPIKGTMPRYADPILDETSKNRLIHSDKDRAENVMIVDLLRNDLSVYAETGSVKTPKLFNIESFNQVHHMVSEVEAILKPEVNPFEVLMSALPGGSITGAPKIRALQIIEELEGAPRGAYCGSMGYFNADGTGSWNILIRSIQKYQNDISIWAGGGITIASDCDAEYQECFDKVSALLDLLNTWYRPEN